MADGAVQSEGSYRPGYELVAERILQLISESGLRPGDRMPTEKELAARLDASRSVVREAVKILSAIGRVKAHKGRGLYVADDEGMLRAIGTAVDTCRQGHDTGQAALFDRGDDEFHLAVAVASHNQFLVTSVREARRLQRQSSTIGLQGMVGGHAAEAVEEHATIYRAIRDGKPDEAAQAAGVHLDNTLEDYRREIQRRVFG